ncbi:putative anthocyanidin reductase [Hordeum vulgare subsp. vulgare]|uniref:NAD-dependent epimerase/dehydratase domain-containing protein n=1 Tax=Hordeum vulgare subsp. vulgare TaxID=112509 RepID=A0A8I6YIH4_HORVV|nr:putative anthocyanidin reductase [Hordeum vulgare subsp. vulgare]
MGSVAGGGASPEKDQPVCVTGATGYVGSWLVRTLLLRGRRVHATARDPAKARRMLSAVEGKERLRVFRADMAEEGSFDDALAGCATLFHVAASMDLHLSPDHHDAEERVRSQVLEPATRGTINVLRSCVRAGTVRRVVFTSSVSTLAAAGAEAAAVDESCLRDLDDVWAAKPIGWVYILSKRLAEEAAFGFARENGLPLVSAVLPTVAGPFLTPAVPTSVQLLLSPVTRDPKLSALLASVHARFGCVPLAHVQDACDAHLFLADAPAAEGRYICAGGSHTTARIARLLASHYTPFNPEKRLGDDLGGASPATVVSSKRLLDLGFRFGHDAGDILRDAVAQCVDHGFLEPPRGRE